MKVLHYISGFSLPSETFIYDLINNLEDAAIDNYILTHARQLEKERPFAKVHVISEKVSFFKKIYFKLFKSWSVRNGKGVIKYIRELNPDVIHAHFGPNGVKIAGLIFSTQLKKRIVISMHGTDTTQYPLMYVKYKHKLQALTKNDNVTFTFPSQFLHDQFEKNVNVKFNNNAYIVSNSFNENFKNSANPSFKYGDKLKLVSTGRFIECKGFKYLIEAVSLLNNDYINWELLIIGDGGLKDTLKKTADELGILHKIYFCGVIEHAKVAKRLADSHIYIQPSVVDPRTNQTESFGVSVIEAVVSGLPVIVTDAGGLPDTVCGGHENFAKIVNQNNASEICDAILSIINNYIHKNSYKTLVEDKYSKDRQVSNTIAVYQKNEP